MRPLVAVVTLTIPGREEWLELRKKEISRQSYARIEHVVVLGPGIKGALRNDGARIAAEEVGADIIVNADDDDILLPTGVEQRVDRLEAGAELCGTSHYAAYDLRCKFGSLVRGNQVHDTSLAYWIRIWKEHPFDSTRRGSEALTWMHNFKGRIADLKSLGVFIYITHGSNYVARPPLNSLKMADDTAEVQRMMGGAWRWYSTHSLPLVPRCFP